MVQRVSNPLWIFRRKAIDDTASLNQVHCLSSALSWRSRRNTLHAKEFIKMREARAATDWYWYGTEECLRVGEVSSQRTTPWTQSMGLFVLAYIRNWISEMIGALTGSKTGQYVGELWGWYLCPLRWRRSSIFYACEYVVCRLLLHGKR